MKLLVLSESILILWNYIFASRANDSMNTHSSDK